jgi:hypothetical protein
MKIDKESEDFACPVTPPALPLASVAGNSGWEHVSVALLKPLTTNVTGAASALPQPHNALYNYDNEGEKALSMNDDDDDNVAILVEVRAQLSDKDCLPIRTMPQCWLEVPKYQPIHGHLGDYGMAGSKYTYFMRSACTQ